MLKQFILRDLRTDSPPPLTHVYFFAGSEECGTRGLLSQLGLTLGLSLISLGVSTANPVYFLASVPFLPLALYRFGITGTRYFVENLSETEKASIRAAIAVDSVGKGRLYIPENEMGANFIRAMFPYEGSERLNDLLEEAAHLNHIPYSRFIAGGTTDSVAFLEERPVLRRRRREKHIPAAALITMSPGKCSPFVVGGKLHTAQDTPDRVYPKPLAEVMTILDYAFDILEGGRAASAPSRDFRAPLRAPLPGRGRTVPRFEGRRRAQPAEYQFHLSGQRRCVRLSCEAQGRRSALVGCRDHSEQGNA